VRAMQVADFGAPLELVDVASPEPDSGEVLVTVERAGVNYPDLLLIQGRYQARPPVPFAPGFEVSGRIAALGDAVADLSVGERVAAFVPYGGYAEEVVAPATSVFPVPEEVSFEVAAVLPVAYGTGIHALVDRAALAPGETLVVLGASGGVGLAAVDVGKRLGATVVGCVGSEWKMGPVREMGADHVLDYTAEDVRERILELTDGRGADVVFDPVGGDAFDAALRYLAYKGRLLVIGFTSGRIPQIPANRLLLKGNAAVGVFWGQFAEREPEANRRNFRRLLEWAVEGEIRPRVAEVLPLEEAPRALETLAARRAVGKIVLRVGDA